MTAQKYCFKSLVEEIEVFILSTKSDLLEQEWEYTKRMVQAHCESPSQAWQDFEHTLTGEKVLPALQGVILNLLSYVPEERLKGFHKAIEIGRARAVGMSREEALERHLEAFPIYKEESPKLRLIEGGIK